MKKNLLVWIVWILVVLWVSNAQSLTLSTEWDWKFGKWCIVPVDIYMDSEWEKIRWADLVIYSSMDFVDFVPNEDLFTYFLPPVVSWNIITIWAFSMEDSNLDSWVVWTIYLRDDINPDWIVRWKFSWLWKTTDTNLLNERWEELLKHVEDVSVFFSDEKEACISDNVEIDWWYSDVTLDDIINRVIWDIQDEQDSDIIYDSKSLLYKDYLIVWWCILLLLILIIVLLRKYKKHSWKNY